MVDTRHLISWEKLINYEKHHTTKGIVQLRPDLEIIISSASSSLGFDEPNSPVISSIPQL